jgi:hypothetical protein
MPASPVDKLSKRSRMTCVLAVGVNWITGAAREKPKSCSEFTLARAHLHGRLVLLSTPCKHCEKTGYPQKRASLVNYYYLYIKKTCKP